MAETISLWTWSAGWVAILGFIFGAALWAIGWSGRGFFTLWSARRIAVVPRSAKIIACFNLGIVLVAGCTVAFGLVQQGAFRFSSVSVEKTDFVFRNSLGFEMARHSRSRPQEVSLVGQGGRSGYLIVKDKNAPEILSQRSEDQLGLERIRKLLLQRGLP